jgi:hypothetical protein
MWMDLIFLQIWKPQSDKFFNELCIESNVL